jgi:hypothetical protein
MINLADKNSSYLLISPDKKGYSDITKKTIENRLFNILYSKDYILVPIKGYYDGIFENSFIAVSSENNETLRKDALLLMNELKQDSLIIKYNSEESAKRISKDGSERLLSINLYSDSNEKLYLYNGLSFSFMEQKRYFFPKKKEDIKNGSIIEYFNQNKWNKKTVLDLDTEYESLYKLLIKYEKLRIPY